MDTRVRTIDAPRAASPSAPRPTREFKTRNPAAASRRDAYNARRSEASTSATSTGVVRGRVLRHGTDEPLAGASITAAAKGNNSPLGPWPTSADGAFEAAALPAGELRFSVKDAAGKPLYDPSRESNGATRLLLKTGETTDTVLRVFEGYTITGLVSDKETSEPLKGAKISLADKKVPPAISGDDGRYILKGVPPQMGHNIQADLAGFVIQGDSGTYTALPADTFTVTKNIPMVPSVLVKGQVVNAAGDGIGGAKLNWSSNASLETPSAISDANGYFQFPVEPLRDGSLVIEASGYAWKREGVTVRNEDVTDLRIVLEKAGKIIGKVIDPESHGVADASITVEDTYSIAFSRMNSVRQVARSSADGTFTADDVASGTYTLTARADGHAPGTARVTVREGQTTTGVEIRLGKELTIEGRVVDGNDKPVPAEILAFGLSMPQINTDQDGRFTLRGLEPGDVTLWVMTRKDGMRKEVSVKAGARDLVIRMADFAIVHCLVVDAITKEPINKFEVGGGVEITRKGEPPNGFRITMEPKDNDGYWDPFISSEGYATKTFKVENRAKPGDYYQTMELGPGGTARGRVIDAATGDPVKDVAVSMFDYSRNGKSASPAYTDAEGRFSLPGLPSGEVTLSVVAPQPYAEVQKRLEITDGEITDVGDIKIGGVGSILVRTLGPDGKPAPNEKVNLGFRVMIENIFDPHTDDKGEFLFKDLRPGEYTVYAFQESQKVTLEPNENKVVEFRAGATSWSGSVTTSSLPMPEGKITLKRKADGMEIEARVFKGNFSFPHLYPGDYSVTVFDGIVKPTPWGTSTYYQGVLTEEITIPDSSPLVKDLAFP